MSNQNILEVKNLTKHFKVGHRQIVHAVDDVSFTIPRGKTLGIVGESGYYQSKAEGTEALPEENADDFSGSVCFLKCQNDGA